MLQNLKALPEGLPVPIDDGLAMHLEGMVLPNMTLPSTDGSEINLAEFANEKVVIYVYPMTGQPTVPLPEGWDAIPGARGCTPQACDFSDHYQSLKALKVAVFGLSSQTTQYQLELKNRLHLPFELLSDAHFELKNRLNLPVFHVQEMQLYKRITLIAMNNIIKKVFYPVFPPNENAKQVLDFLRKSETLEKPEQLEKLAKQEKNPS